MSKVVLVCSFDEPEDGNLKPLIAEIMDCVRPILKNETNHHVWLGIREQAKAVLNVIGID